MFTPADYKWEVTVRVAPEYLSKTRWGSDVPNEVTISNLTSWLRHNNVRFYSELSWCVPHSPLCPAYDLAFNNESDWLTFILTFSDNIVRKVDITKPL